MHAITSFRPARTGPSALRAACSTPAGQVGDTPLLRIGPPFTGHGSFWAKLEGSNPGGIKDRPGLFMVERARARGDLLPEARIVESTSGTLGLGLALAGLTFGHPVTLVTDPGMEPGLRRMLSAYGARVVTVAQPDPVGGWQQARRVAVAGEVAAEPGAWCPDQYHNPDNAAAYAPLAAELAEQLGRVDVLVAAVGTGGHSAGTARVLKRRFPELRVVGVDTVGSVIFGQPDRTRLMRGLGSSIHPSNVDYALFDQVHWVAPAEAVWACRALARTHYASGGWSVGAVALVSRWLADTLPPDQVIAAVFPDGPARYSGTVFNDTFCRDHDLLGVPEPVEPEVIAHPGEREATCWTRCATVRDPLDRAPGSVQDRAFPLAVAQ